MKIGKYDPADKVCLVAEVGINHEGSLSRAKELTYQAALSGADAVKFQTCLPASFAPFGDKNRLEMLQEFHLSFAETEELFGWAEDNSIHVFSTPLDLESAEFLASLRSMVKVSSGDITYAPLLEKLAGLEVDIILSTGGSNLQEITQALSWCSPEDSILSSSREVALLHCVSLYPASPSALNLRAIPTMRANFPNHVIGFSDHSLGLDAAVVAASLGATIIEKHFTLDKDTSDFRDHKLSLEPSELLMLRGRLDLVEESLGSAEKLPGPEEAATLHSIRRSIFFNKAMKRGSVISAEDLSFRRPGVGLVPAQAVKIVGCRLLADVERGDAVELQMMTNV